MGNQGSATLKNPLTRVKAWNPGWTDSTFEQSQAETPNVPWSFTIESAIPENEARRNGLNLVEDLPQPARDVPAISSEMTIADFIWQRFVPEHVASMSSAGRDYFHAMLKHVLSPELVDRSFHADLEPPRSKLKAVPGWPYLDTQRLCDVEPDHIQRIINTALEQGYSVQTVTHIRNVIRKVFSHARKVLCFAGENPAAGVVLPHMAHQPTQVLTLDQLQLVIQNMRYPERDVALLGVLTGMSIAEIFGLQWKYVNLSETRRVIDEEWIPARMIAVRKQSYRSQIRMVTGSRKRDVLITDLTARIFGTMKTRRKNTAREVFVFSSRNGTPINQDNVAARRLKLIGKRIDMPWLSWNVFHRTSASLSPESYKRLEVELKNWLFPEGAGPANRTTSQAVS